MINHSEILFEDNHCLAVDKPAGMLTMGDSTGDRSMVDEARDYLREKYHKPGNVFIGVVHRLDRPVSGVLLLARTSKAASRISNQFRTGSIAKTYQCLVEGAPAAESGTLTNWLLKDASRNHVSCVPKGTAKSKESTLRYRVLQRTRRLTLLEIEPITGRSHQIRVQLATNRLPIHGDVRYGSTTELGRRIALHATMLKFSHPTQKSPVTVESQRPVNWKSLTGDR